MVWQSRPIFISSTFSDLQAERDHLFTHVFPALEERLKARRLHLEWVDLRLGVAAAGETQAETRELQVLKVCLAEVRRCRPFLVVLLGDRYGWVPPAERITAAAGEEGFATDLAGRSVTDLEIRFGVLADPGQQPRSYFYFREPLPYDNMPREVAALYSDAHGSGGQEPTNSLAELKAEIERALPQRVRRYSVGWDRQTNKVTGLEAWGQTVLEDIWSDLETDTASDEAREPLSWQEAERLALDDYIEDRARDFVGRAPVLARLEGLARSAAQEGAAWGLVLTGAAGTGKSATFGELHRRLKRTGAFVLAHAAGASPRAPSVDDMLRRWIEELASALGIDAGIADNPDPDTTEATFRSLLGRMAAERRVVVLIDALDQFEATTRGRFVTWLPRLWPENARLIATAIPGEASGALAERTGVKAMPLPPLDAAEVRRIAEGICARYHRTLEPEVLDALLARRGADGPAWGNTLWLMLAVEELNLVDADDFARASRAYKGSGAEQLRALMLDIVAGLPTDIVRLYGATFDRAEELFGTEFARAFLGLIAVGRAGWRESDFRVLLPRLANALTAASPVEPWNELRFASLRRLFRGQLRQRGNLALWDVCHGQMRPAAREWLHRRGVIERIIHADLAAHLLALAADDPLRISETMVHLMGSDDWHRATAYYGNADLTGPEIDGATRVLANHVIAASDCHHPLQDLLDIVVQAADVHKGGPAGTVAHRLLFNLDGALAERADLAARATIVKAADDTLVRLTKANPRHVGWQRDLSVSQERIGDVLLAQGNLLGTLSSYQASLAIRDRLAKADPRNSILQHDLSVSHDKIGYVLQVQGNLPAALSSYQSSHEIFDRLTKADPKDANCQRDLSVSHERIGDVLLAQGNLLGALSSYQASLAIRDRLAKADPRNAILQQDLSVSHDKIGNVLRAQGNLLGALSNYQASLAIRDRLAKADPGNGDCQHGLSVSHDKIGNVLEAQGNLAAALSCYQASHEIFDRLVKADPGNAGWQRDLSVSQERIGDVLQAQGNLLGALSSYQASLAIRDRLAKADPRNAIWQRDLSVSHDKIGNVLGAQGNLVVALSNYQASLLINVRLAEADPGNPQWQHDLSVSHNRIGDVLMAQGNLSAALSSYQSSHETFGRLAKGEPGNARWQRNLSVSHNKIGDVLQAQGHLSAALSSYQVSHDIFDRLIKADPGNAGWLADLAASLGKMGLLLAQMGRRSEALAMFRKGREIVQPLAERVPAHRLWINYLERFDGDIAQLELQHMEETVREWQEEDRALADPATHQLMNETLVRSGFKPLDEMPLADQRYHARGYLKAMQEPLPGIRTGVHKAYGIEDGLVISIFANSGSEDMLREAMRRRNLMGAPSDLPFETQRAIVAELVESGRLRIGVASCSDAERGVDRAKDLPEVPDDLVRQIISDPSTQELLQGFMAYGKLSGAPSDLPFENQRAMVAALIKVGAIRVGPRSDAHSANPPSAPSRDRGAPQSVPTSSNRAKRSWWPFSGKS